MRKIFFRAQDFSFENIFSAQLAFLKEILQFQTSMEMILCWMKFLSEAALASKNKLKFKTLLGNHWTIASFSKIFQVLVNLSSNDHLTSACWRSVEWYANLERKKIDKGWLRRRLTVLRTTFSHQTGLLPFYYFVDRWSKLISGFLTLLTRRSLSHIQKSHTRTNQFFNIVFGCLICENLLWKTRFLKLFNGQT